MSTLKVEEIQHISNSNNAVSIASDSSVSLKHSGSAKLATTSTGVTITGACAATSFSGDGSALTGLSSGVTSDAQFNTVAGTNAGDAFDGTNAVNNTVVGYNAGTEINTGLDNVVVGYDAASSLTAGQYNVVLGSGALKTVANGWNNVAIGWQALYNLGGYSKNIAIGTKAGYSLSSSQGNTYIGYYAGYAHTGGSSVMIGYDAGKTIGAVDGETFIGYEAGQLTTTGVENTFIGYRAGKANTTGRENVFVGRICGEDNTTGQNNTGLGCLALMSLTTGYGNTCIGRYAGGSLTGGSSFAGGLNTCVGLGAGSTLTTGKYNIVLGAFADASSATVEGEITLGTSSISSIRCNTTSISSLSDRRDKTDIVNLTTGLDFINTLIPRQFKWQTRDGNAKDGLVRAGFIAQELQEAQKDCDFLDLVYDSNPDKLEATQGNLIPVLVKAIQELSAQVNALKEG